MAGKPAFPIFEEPDPLRHSCAITIERAVLPAILHLLFSRVSPADFAIFSSGSYFLHARAQFHLTLIAD
jgi:hypothetical protein